MLIKRIFYLVYKLNQLQNYYGIAIRPNANTSVSDMRKVVGAVLYQFCPLTATYWCKYKVDQVDQVNGTNKYVEKPGLPIPLRKKLEPIFRELSTPELLVGCPHGNTQNSNESLYGLIWAHCPKIFLLGDLFLKCRFLQLFSVLILGNEV